MAKRAVPEINAGSMADIAFLLLIFFLVTTTMDRDQAYQKRIPKPVEIPPENLPPQEPRNRFAILTDPSGKVFVQGRFDGRPGRPLLEVDQLSEKIVEFFSMNRSLTADEIIRDIANPNYKGYNFPFYSRATLQYLKTERDKANDNIDLADEAGDESLVKFHTEAMQKWNEKIKVLEFLKIPELVEINIAAHVRVEVFKDTPYELLVTIHQEIEKATNTLRNEAAAELGWESYTTIKRRYDINEGDSKKEEQNAEDFAKLEALKMLFPVRVVEVTPKN